MSAAVLPLHARASRGDVSSYIELAQLFMQAIDAKLLPPLDGLIAAETYGRLAASSGEASALKYLGGVFAIRMREEVRLGRMEDAAFFGAEAIDCLEMAEDAGEDDAGMIAANVAAEAPVEAIAMAKSLKAEDRRAIQNAHRQTIHLAANGDIAALHAMIDEALAARAGDRRELDALAIAEVLAEHGAIGGNESLTLRLVGVRLHRAVYERSEGRLAVAAQKDGEALATFALVGAPADVRRLADDLSAEARAIAISRVPTLLSMIDPEGAA